MIDWFRRYWMLIPAFLSCIALMIAAVFVVVDPSPSLLREGGYLVVITWGIFCLLGGLCNLVGLMTKRRLTRLFGASLSASASLTWATSLILQAVTTNSAARTAACLASVLTLIFTQQWVNVYMESRR